MKIKFYPNKGKGMDLYDMANLVTGTKDSLSLIRLHILGHFLELFPIHKPITINIKLSESCFYSVHVFPQPSINRLFLEKRNTVTILKLRGQSLNMPTGKTLMSRPSS